MVVFIHDPSTQKAKAKEAMNSRAAWDSWPVRLKHKSTKQRQLSSLGRVPISRLRGGSLSAVGVGCGSYLTGHLSGSIGEETG